LLLSAGEEGISWCWCEIVWQICWGESGTSDRSFGTEHVCRHVWLVSDLPCHRYSICWLRWIPFECFNTEMIFWSWTVYILKGC